MMDTPGPLLYSFFEDHLKVQKGLRPTSVSSYRDAIRLFLHFVAKDASHKITRLLLSDLTADRVLRFLRHLEEQRSNHVPTRNHRLAALRTFFAYIAGRVPEMLAEAERVQAIPTKRTPPPQTRFLERDEIQALFSHLPSKGVFALRDHALLLFLYNTGARVQEAAELCTANLELKPQPRVQLHGKGDKWRVCPLWEQTASVLKQLLEERQKQSTPDSPVFISSQGRALTRFGIYKIVRRHAIRAVEKHPGSIRRPFSPHVLRHTTAVHLLEAGVEINVIRAWLGHVSLDTTNRYAEINIRAKEAALQTCEPPASAEFPRRAVWRDDQTLLKWLDSL
jgi:site-specific recombinase XerD